MFAKNGMTIVGAGVMIALIPLGSVYAQANQSDFFLIFASDPQIGYCDPPQCQTGQDELKQTKIWNQVHLSSIAKFANKPNDFLGLVINGDLTNTADPDQLTFFSNTYMHTPNLRVYPGLGNHDYLDYIDVRCAVDGALIPGGCFRNEIYNFVSWIRSTPDIKGFDWQGNFAKDPAFLGDPHTPDTLKGSLDYYWDIGNFRFIQLNWNPAYTRNYSVYLWAWGKYQDFQITSGMDWLKDVLEKSSGMTVILNMHGINYDDAFSPTNTDYAASYAQLQKLLDRYPNVGAIFAGHIHYWAGDQSFYNDIKGTEAEGGQSDDERRRIWATNPPATPKPIYDANSIAAAHALAVLSNTTPPPAPALDASSFVTPCKQKIPVLYNGSSSYNLYLTVIFKDAGPFSRSMAWSVIDSRNGDTKPVATGKYEFPRWTAAKPGSKGGCPTLVPTVSSSSPARPRPFTSAAQACGEDCEIGALPGEKACNKYLMRRPVPAVFLANGNAVMDTIDSGTRVLACQGAADLDAAAMRIWCLSESFKNKVSTIDAAENCSQGKGPQLRPTDRKPTWPPPERATWQH